ncbi:DUF1836 domain-containing protein [Bacillus sp. IB182487]|uniref:DUF1836 domain-containing protein n=2 Tax=Metabacillus arenae TaxID=2771434 RepID=A0A926NGF5_9BACI|nr:DUF1836 domain-containing protein [Metabacillus arenae]
MAKLLYGLKGEAEDMPILFFNQEKDNLSEAVPDFLKRYLKKRVKKEYGLSTNEIVKLGNLCELTSFKSTAIQNWIKRDIKELIGPPALGKKYSIEQAAILLIVRDLKTVYDFETIRYVLKALFNTLSDRSDDLISPIKFYEAYARILQDTKEDTCSTYSHEFETHLQSSAEIIKGQFKHLSDKQWLIIKDLLVLTSMSVIASHIEQRANKFLQNHLNYMNN